MSQYCREAKNPQDQGHEDGSRKKRKATVGYVSETLISTGCSTYCSVKCKIIILLQIHAAVPRGMISCPLRQRAPLICGGGLKPSRARMVPSRNTSNVPKPLHWTCLIIIPGAGSSWVRAARMNFRGVQVGIFFFWVRWTLQLKRPFNRSRLNTV